MHCRRRKGAGWCTQVARTEGVVLDWAGAMGRMEKGQRKAEELYLQTNGAKGKLGPDVTSTDGGFMVAALPAKISITQNGHVGIEFKVLPFPYYPLFGLSSNS